MFGKKWKITHKFCDIMASNHNVLSCKFFYYLRKHFWSTLNNNMFFFGILCNLFSFIAFCKIIFCILCIYLPFSCIYFFHSTREALFEKWSIQTGIAIIVLIPTPSLSKRTPWDTFFGNASIGSAFIQQWVLTSNIQFWGLSFWHCRFELKSAQTILACVPQTSWTSFYTPPPHPPN